MARMATDLRYINGGVLSRELSTCKLCGGVVREIVPGTCIKDRHEKVDFEYSRNSTTRSTSELAHKRGFDIERETCIKPRTYYALVTRQPAMGS